MKTDEQLINQVVLRNIRIRSMWRGLRLASEKTNDESLQILADEWYLSYEAIRNIVYDKNKCKNN